MQRQSNITYSDIMEWFKISNPCLEHEIIDYRPHGKYAIRIELRHGIMMNVFYDIITERFNILKIERRK